MYLKHLLKVVNKVYTLFLNNPILRNIMFIFLFIIQYFSSCVLYLVKNENNYCFQYKHNLVWITIEVKRKIIIVNIYLHIYKTEIFQ